jgi:periplasmic protein TonB
MSAHPDILDERESLRAPLLTSLLFHGLVFAGLAIYGLTGMSRAVQWGDEKSLGGGAVGITPVKRIPLPSREGKINPVANDTESVVPSKPVVKPEVKKAPVVDPNAIALKSKRIPKKQSDVVASTQKYTPAVKTPNQVYSRTGAATVSPLYSQAPGGGGVGSGAASPFGHGFAWYEQLLRDKVARNWHSEELDARLQTPAVVTFELMRDGTARNVKVTQSSGNFAMDQSAQRAIMQSSPFPPLPPQFPQSSAIIEFWFRIQR